MSRLTNYIFVTINNKVIDEIMLADDDAAENYCQKLTKEKDEPIGVYRLLTLWHPEDIQGVGHETSEE